MSAISIPNTNFIAGAAIKAADHNANWAALIAWSTTIDQTNFSSFAGNVTWNISSNVLAQTITSSSTSGIISQSYSGVLAAGASAVKFTGTASNTAGNAAWEVNWTNATTSIPAILATNAGPGPAISASNAGSGNAITASNGGSATGDTISASNGGTGNVLNAVSTALLAAGKSVGRFLSSFAQTTGKGLIDAELTNASSTIPILYGQNAGTGPHLSFNDNTPTENFRVNQNGTIGAGGSLVNRWLSNLSIGYSAGTFSVQGAGGVALSASNPGYIVVPSTTTPGLSTALKLTSNQTFTDRAGTNTISGNNFGVTAGVAWAQDIPFFLYAVLKSDSTAINFAISRKPCAVQSATAGNSGVSGTATATNEDSFFYLGSPTLANYAQQPCACLGSFRMQKTTTSNDWTVQSLSNADGLGLFHESTFFVMPTGQNGAASGKHFSNNGGTAPTFGVSNYAYTISLSGIITLYGAFNSVSVSGVGAVPLTLSIPYQIQNNSSQVAVNHIAGLENSAAGSDMFFFNMQASTNLINIVRSFGNAFSNNADYLSSSSHSVQLKYSYKAYIET